MNTNNEILDAIEILADKKIGENITKVLTGICTSVNINKNTCVMNSNGVSSTVQFYGSPPEVNELYRIFVPSNNMSRSFIIVSPKFIVNPNLLDNWYFGRPVNQRVGTEWLSSSSSAIPCVDRWNWWGQYITGTRLNLLDDGLQLAKPAEGQGQGLYQAIIQKVEKTRVPVGATVTLSALVKAEADASVVLAINDSYNVLSVQANVWELITFTLNAPSVEQTYSVSIQRNSGGIAFTVKAAKLELGPTQTLAHQENGVWVLNEVPDYGEQLRRCQRYFRRISPPQYAGFARGCAYNANSVRVMIPFETMRTSPSLNLNNATGIFASNSGIGDVFSLTFSGVWSTPESVTFDVAKTGAFVDGKEYILRGGNNGYIDISADL